MMVLRALQILFCMISSRPLKKVTLMCKIKLSKPISIEKKLKKWDHLKTCSLQSVCGYKYDVLVLGALLDSTVGMPVL